MQWVNNQSWMQLPCNTATIVSLPSNLFSAKVPKWPQIIKVDKLTVGDMWIFGDLLKCSHAKLWDRGFVPYADSKVLFGYSVIPTFSSNMLQKVIRLQQMFTTQTCISVFKPQVWDHAQAMKVALESESLVTSLSPKSYLKAKSESESTKWRRKLLVWETDLSVWTRSSSFKTQQIMGQIFYSSNLILISSLYTSWWWSTKTKAWLKPDSASQLSLESYKYINKLSFGVNHYFSQKRDIFLSISWMKHQSKGRVLHILVQSNGSSLARTHTLEKKNNFLCSKKAPP